MVTRLLVRSLCLLILGMSSANVSAENNDMDGYPITFNLNGLWGAKDKNGVIVIPPIYNNSLHFKEGISAARLGKKIGYIDENGRVAIPFEYDEVLGLKNGLIGVCAEGNCGYLDTRGNVVIPLTYKKINYFSDIAGIAAVERASGWGVIDMAGREIIAPTLKDSPKIVEYEGDGFIIGFKARRDGMLYDLKGNKLLELNYDQIAFNVWSGKWLNDNLFTVAIDGKWGFIDKSGNVIIPPRYDKRGYFFRGYAELVRDGKVYRVDKRGAEELIGDWVQPTP